MGSTLNSSCRPKTSNTYNVFPVPLLPSPQPLGRSSGLAEKEGRGRA
jgi:hypothetical protein